MGSGGVFCNLTRQEAKISEYILGSAALILINLFNFMEVQSLGYPFK